MEFFINLLIKEISSFYIKLLIIPLITIGVLFLIQIIALKLLKPNYPWNIHKRLTFLKSIVITIILYNIFWAFIIYQNGVFIFDWSSFSFTRSNIYLMLSPLLIGYLLLLFIYFRIQNQIKKEL